MTCPAAADPWLDLAEIAERFGVNRATAWRWCRVGANGRRLLAERLGGKWKAKESNVRAFIDAGTAAGLAPDAAPAVDPNATPAGRKARAAAAMNELRKLGY
jgi:hypothetical protein